MTVPKATVASQTAAQFFEDRIPQYESLMRRAVPGYQALTTALVEELPTVAAHVLELGCGTGNLSSLLVERFAEAHCTFVDASEEMVAVTEQRLRAAAPAAAGKATFVVGQFEHLGLPDGSFDLVTSAIALHHVADKGPVYRRIHDLLAPGGRFCFADQLRLTHATAQQRHWEAFLAFWRQPGHCSEEEIRDLLDHATAHDHYETLADQFALLEAAGFRELDAPWRQGFWGVITATA
jgi:tRNA (cmo5U34)-methyltransferase